MTVQTNTYQAVLTTSGSVSFVMFNYDTLTWTTGEHSGGDTRTGLGGNPAVVSIVTLLPLPRRLRIITGVSPTLLLSGADPEILIRGDESRRRGG